MVQFIGLLIQQSNLIMSRLQAELNQFTGNEGVRKQFMNLYRLVKTHSVLNSLFFSGALPSETYNVEVKDTMERINLLKKQLEKYDVLRFCQLWGIEYEYSTLKVSESSGSIGVKVGNMFPQVNEEVFQATTYGDIHDIFSRFCAELTKLKSSEGGLPQAFRKSIDNLVMVEGSLGQRFQRLSDPLDEQAKEQLKDGLGKFKVEFSKFYGI